MSFDCENSAMENGHIIQEIRQFYAFFNICQFYLQMADTGVTDTGNTGTTFLENTVWGCVHCCVFLLLPLFYSNS